MVHVGRSRSPRGAGAKGPPHAGQWFQPGGPAAGGVAEFTSWNLAADNVPAAVSLAGHIALRCDTVRHDEERAPATMKSEQTVVQAARALQGGALVAFPTETVYGLGADATNPAAVARIYAAKGRPSSHPLIVHLLLLKTFHTGPLTLRRKRSCSPQRSGRAPLPSLSVRRGVSPLPSRAGEPPSGCAYRITRWRWS